MDQAATEQTVAITSFLSFFFLQLIGVLWHYRVVVKSGRHLGSVWQYISGDYKTTTAPLILVLLGTSLFAAFTGVATYINPELVWATLMSGQLPLTSLGIAYPIIQSGYSWDSTLNAGDNDPKPDSKSAEGVNHG